MKGIVKRNNHILVEEQSGVHSKGKGFYYRPIGGTIELGKHSQETLVREFHEELDVERGPERCGGSTVLKCTARVVVGELASLVG